MYGIALSDNIAQRLIKYLKGEFRCLYKVLINKDTDMVIIGMIPVSDMGGEYYVSVKCPPVLGFFSIVSRAPPADELVTEAQAENCPGHDLVEYVPTTSLQA
jgi:hypothetical protein